MKWWNDGTRNVRSNISPGEEFISGRLKFKRRRASKETRLRISQSLKGHKAWNKGIKTGPESEDIREKKRKSALLRSGSPWNIGRVSWSKGLKVETDSRLEIIFKKQKGQKRIGNYVKGSEHPSWNPNRKEYKRYLDKVRRLSEENYSKNIDIINPDRKIRTLAGIPEGHQLDHKISAKFGFLNNIDPNIIASVDNLQMLPWKDNIMKGWK